LDPFSLDRNVGFAFGLMNLRRYEDAVQQLNSTLELDPTYATAQRLLAQTFELKGQHAEAVSLYLGWLDQVLVPERAPQARADLEAAYAHSGWRGFWRRELALAEAEADSPGTIWKPQYARYSGPLFVAERHARLGDRAIAVALLEKAYDARHHLVASLAVNPVFDSVRSEPRFQALVRRTGQTP
jgi:tetratricopeptide (TPR) repeat protein